MCQNWNSGVSGLELRGQGYQDWSTKEWRRQNNAMYDVFLPREPQNRAKTLVFKMFLQHPKKHT